MSTCFTLKSIKIEYVDLVLVLSLTVHITSENKLERFLVSNPTRFSSSSVVEQLPYR